MLLRVLRAFLNNSLKYMNYNGMTQEEFMRIFGPENMHKYVKVPRTPTFVMTDTINNKSQHAHRISPYEPPRRRTNRKVLVVPKNEQKILNTPAAALIEPENLILKDIQTNNLPTVISLLSELRKYISNQANNFSCILNIEKINLHNKFVNICDALCFSINNEHNSLLEDVKKLKTKENILMVNAVVPENFDTIVFNQQAYKSSIISNCVTNNSYNFLPSELPYRLNTSSIYSLNKVNNFLIIKDYTSFNTKARFLLSAKNLQYDLLIIEPYYNKGHYFTPSDIEFMKYKKGNKLNKRFVYAYINMSYIHTQSKFYNEKFISNEGTIKYWSEEWKQTLFGDGEGSIMDYIIKTGYDGIFIDNIKE